MTVTQRKSLPRGERILPGLWRLRLPLPWSGVPHCNAWAIASGPGIVLIDCGVHEPGSLAALEFALAQVHLRLEHVRLLVCTHAHVDHYGLAAAVLDRAGCELWMHPNHAHATSTADDPDAQLARRIEVGRQSGVPEAALVRYAEESKGQPSLFGPVVLPDRELVDGVAVETDLGIFRAIETPGHAPSHVCLHAEDPRLLITGDHVLGRPAALWYDVGWTPDPAGEFLHSLDRVQTLDARLCLAGHGRPFTDLAGHVASTRDAVTAALDAIRAAIAQSPRTPVELVPVAFGVELNRANGAWLLGMALCYLRHLERRGEAAVVAVEPQRWASGPSAAGPVTDTGGE